MSTLTIRNLPVALVQRIKKSAKQKGVSMEQEVRNLLESQYETRASILKRIRQRWQTMPPTSGEEILKWRDEGRR